MVMSVLRQSLSMVPWLLFLFVAVASSTASNSEPKKTRETKSVDAETSSTDFFPTYGGFAPFPLHSQPVAPPHDLAALQQTHVLGDHRFQQPRFNQFQNQPLLFSQQTQFGPPFQPTFPPQNPPDVRPAFQESRNVQFPEPPREQQNYIPQKHNFNEIRPQQQQPIFQNPTPPAPKFQPPNNNNQFFPPRPVQNQPSFPDARPSSQEARNVQFPEPPREQQNFVERPQQNNFNDGSFRNEQIFRPPRPVNNAPAFPNPQVQSEEQRNQNNQFQPFRSPNNFNNQQFADQRNPSFPTNNNNNQFQDQAAHQQITGARFPQQQQQQFQPKAPAPSTVPQQNFPRQQQYQPAPANVQPFTNDQFQFRPTQNVLPSIQPQSGPSFENQFQQRSPSNAIPQSQPQSTFSLNPNRKPAFLPTAPPKTEEYIRAEQPSSAPKRPLLPLIPSDIPSFKEPSTTQQTFSNGLVLQKSQEQIFNPKYNQYQSQTFNEISPAPTKAAATTPSPTVRSTPKPLVQEITINLATTPAPDKKDKSAKKEKTQEEIINEQIQKLLNSHNLEIVNNEKDFKAGASPLDLPVPELPDHLKDKYQIKLVNSDVLNELKGGKIKKDKPAVPTSPALPPLPDLPDHIKKQYDIKLVQKDELFKQFKIGEGGKLVTNADLVSPLPGNAQLGNESTSVFLANGQQLQILQLPQGGEIKDSIAKATTFVSTTTTTTSKPPRELFEELAKGAIPPGADVELIKQNANGEVEKVNDLTAAKKVTFVLLEEQPDGSVKIQGVKGNGNNEKTEKDTIDSLLQQIKEGSLKLPPSQVLSNDITQGSTSHGAYVTVSPNGNEYTTESYTTAYSDVTYGTTFSPADKDIYHFTTQPPETTHASTVSSYQTTKKPKSKSRPSFLPTPAYSETTYSARRQKTSKRPLRRKPSTTSTTAQYEYDEDDYNQRSSTYNGEGQIHQDVIGQETSIQQSPALTTILQEYGLLEMAKFLDQSGLDSILNETGPYTIFIPTDAAFANLQEQLGGTDKAEDKFRENPRLLSGLLLHHVVPGSFKISDLQDEMTGVSLAGTQLRVNTYNIDRKDPIVTINGAVVSATKKDIQVPQGLAHAVDRVLFPLPVGDLIQTLKGDRERRFGKFLKSIEASGLTDLFTGSKTYTLFAPTDRAFAALSDSELDKLLTRREAARTIVLRHIMPGTLYSAGMHFFQIKESMEKGQKITIQKELGRVKVNTAQVVNTNIPSTNGVIHAVDTLL